MPVFSYLDVWRMIDLEGKTLSALTFLSGCISGWRNQLQLLQADKITPLSHPMETRAQFVNALLVLEDVATRMSMPGASRGIARARVDCINDLAAPIGRDTHRFQRVIGHAERVVVTFMDELEGRHLFTLAPSHAQFYGLSTPFGEGVEAAFPSAAYDITEASKCRALYRWTATVMHLMRVLEVGLGALARHYGLVPGANWNTLLNEIEKKSREVGKKSHGEEEEKWAAEAALQLRFIKNAWRNHAMHPLEKYDEERAVAIYENTRSFMKHLATKLVETADTQTSP